MVSVAASALAVLEMVFIFVVLLLLHGLRKFIGAAGFYVSIGLLFVFSQVAGAADLKIVTGLPGFNFNMSSGVLMLPCLTAIMVIYIADGTLEAQRLIMSLIAALGIYTYLASATVTQIGWNGGGEGGIPALLASLFRDGVHTMSANVVSFALDLFLLPIIYQRLRNWGCRLFFCVTGALFIGQALDSILYSSICYWGRSIWITEIGFSYLSRASSILILAGIASFYLSRLKTEEPGTGGRGTLDILVSFFGGPGRARALERNLRKSEERYRLLFRGAADMIVSMDRTGIIFDANSAALRLTGLNEQDDMGSITIQELSDISDEFLRNIPLDGSNPDSIDPSANSPQFCSVVMTRTGREAELSFSPVDIAGNPMLLVFGRDVTEQKKLAREREEWQEKMAHRQRVESIGRLAGGIAHDFNNFLHAMQGHLDIIRYMHPVEDPDVERHLDRIDAITEKAAVLTKQLLGFARRGNYNESEIELISFLRSAFELFLPGTTSCPVTLNFHPPRGERFPVRGDAIQLQQAILNILFNARDAMKDLPEDKRILSVSISRTTDPAELHPPAEASGSAKTSSLAVIRIRDAGPGIPPAVLSRIFEPFFTTKPVGEGTGMGLPMAYGILLSHRGWLEAGNDPEGGAVFTLVIPECPSAVTDAE